MLAFCTRTVDFFVVVITPFLSTIRIWKDDSPTLFLAILMDCAAAAGTDLTRIPSRYTCTIDCAGALTLSTTLLPTTLFEDGSNTACGTTVGICEPRIGLTMRFAGCTLPNTTAGAVATGRGNTNDGIVDGGTIGVGTVDGGVTRRAIVVVVSGASSPPSSPPPPPPPPPPPSSPAGTVVVGNVVVGNVVVGADALGGEELSLE